MTESYMQIAIGIVVFAGLCYAVLCGILALAIGRVRTGLSKQQPFVSVIIAARNEQDSIHQCLEAIRSQTYPTDLYEVICVNDRSTDKTGAILSQWESQWEHLKILTITSVPEGISPKKHALTQAAGAAQGEILLQTDADCVVPSAWIASMVKRFDPSVNLVAGVAPYHHCPGLVPGFVRHEYFWNILLSAGSILLGFGTHVSGRNLAFRRSVFKEIDGYGTHREILSGDDTLLMQQIQRSFPLSIATNPDPAAQVFTRPPDTFGVLILQRIRHMSTGRLFHPVQMIVGMVIYGFHMGILGLLVASLWVPSFLLFTVSGFLGKAIVDALAFRRVEKVFGLGMSWRPFLFNEILMLLYFTVFPVLGSIVPVKWKENS